LEREVTFLVKTLEELGEEAKNKIADLTAKAEADELDNKMIASFVDRNAHLIKDITEAVALMQQRVDILSEKP
jgi:gamma-glutamyl:cysteine ligase YbdK (ATP-grasp superfamily)